MKEGTRKIAWFEPAFSDDDVRGVESTMLSGFVNEGPQVRAFEGALCRYFGVPFAVCTPSGTTALALALMAMGIGQGHSVLIPDLTFIGTASAVRLAGAEPILVDVNPTTFTIDIDDAGQQIRGDTRAVIPVHLNGRSASWDDLREFGEKNGLFIIEDAAEAIGSRNDRGLLGTLGNAGCFSLAPTKIITSGQGGFVLTHNQDIRDNLIRLKDHGRLSRSSDLHSETGFNFKVTDLQGALAGTQFEKLDARIRRNLEIDLKYRSGLAGVAGLTFPPRPPAGGYLMWPDITYGRRDDMVSALRAKDIALRPFWPPIHTQPAYLSDRDFPGASEAADRGCWLPSSPSISDSDIECVVRSVVDWARDNG